jgi:diaminopimelate epimerase
MNFSKYHGTGNDFLFIDHIPDDPQTLAKKLCDRHTGIGADGLMFAKPSQKADLAMAYYNADGTLAPMCGNGLRCFVRYALDQGLLKGTFFEIETLAGILEVALNPDDSLSINLGDPRLSLRSDEMMNPAESVTITVDGHAFTLYPFFLGTLHAITLIEPDFDPHPYGEILTSHPRFPHAININFVTVYNPHTIRVITHERGAGWTLSCGTGSAASAYWTHRHGLTVSDMSVKVKGGILRVTAESNVILTGPAVFVASGTFGGRAHD